MDRKSTILIAVLINTGLLGVLLIAALTTQEESAPSSQYVGDALPSMPQLEEKPLFGDALDLTLRQAPVAIASPAEPQQLVLPEPVIEKAPIAHLPTPPAPAPAKEEPVVHKLPPVVKEATPPAAIATPKQTDGSYVEITVKKGDSLEKIAKIHHTSVDEIIKINQLPSSFLRIGQVLRIPTEKTLVSKAIPPKTAPAAQPKKMAEAGPEYYTVKVGDNPWTIAMKHHMKVDELLQLNGLNEERARKLKPGDRLRIR